MSPKEADKHIKSGLAVTLQNTFYNEVFTVIIVRKRERQYRRNDRQSLQLRDYGMGGKG